MQAWRESHPPTPNALKHPFAFIRTRKLEEQNAKVLFLFKTSSS